MLGVYYHCGRFRRRALFLGRGLDVDDDRRREVWGGI